MKVEQIVEEALKLAPVVAPKLAPKLVKHAPAIGLAIFLGKLAYKEVKRREAKRAAR